MALRKSKTSRLLWRILMIVVIFSFASEILISFGFFPLPISGGEIFSLAIPLASYVVAAILISEGEFVYGRPGHAVSAVRRAERPYAFWGFVLFVLAFATVVGFAGISNVLLAHGA